MNFDRCNISTKVNIMKIQNVIELNKVVKRVINKKNQILFPSLIQTQFNLLSILIPALTADQMKVVKEVLLIDIHKKCFPLMQNSSKVKREVSSTLATKHWRLMKAMKQHSIYLKYLEKFSIWSTYQSPGSQITNSFMMLLTPTTDRLTQGKNSNK